MQEGRFDNVGGKWIKGQLVKGSVIDEETRCTHYHTKYDRVAIKFYCCQTYFPCFQCHEENGCGNPDVWPRDKSNEKAILCGACGKELTITAYLNSDNECPSCHAEFNPNCQLHEHYYFES